MNDKKQIPLRISAELYARLMHLAELDFRSLNGEIEFILHDYVTRRRAGGAGAEGEPGHAESAAAQDRSRPPSSASKDEAAL